MRNYGNLSNEELAAEISKGNKELLQVLIIRFVPLVHRMAERYAKHRDETEDLEQIGLIALCNAVKAYSPGKVSFSAFAGMCIKRALIGERRIAGRRRRIPQELIVSLDECDAAAVQTPESIYMEKENLLRLTNSIRLELSSLEYKVLQGYLSGASYSAVAERLGISEKSVDNALRRIRFKLKGEKK